MQEVFIEQLASVATIFPRLDKKELPWWPQFVVSTHSSHIANRTDFSTIRYFRIGNDKSRNQARYTEVLDITKAQGIETDFLHRYLTLTRSDLFFADGVILVEGTSERLFVPAAIKETEHELRSQYVALMEVGGAYAHIFFPLLDFLRIPALIITDIDAVAPGEDNKNKATAVHEGESTSNATIKNWFSGTQDLKPTALLEAAETDAIRREHRYLAYQVPESEGGPCGRTFEDAFLLANPSIENLKLTNDVKEDERSVREAAAKLKKTDFAVRLAIDEPEWKVPRYIERGLKWLLDTLRKKKATIEVPGEEEG